MTIALLLLAAATAAAPEPHPEVALFKKVCLEGMASFKRSEIEPIELRRLPPALRLLYQDRPPQSPTAQLRDRGQLSPSQFYRLKGHAHAMYLMVMERRRGGEQPVRICGVAARRLNLAETVAAIEPGANTESLKPIREGNWSSRPQEWTSTKLNYLVSVSARGPYTVMESYMPGGRAAISSSAQ